MSDFLLYTLGLRDALELDEMVRQFLNEETVETPSSIGTYSYDDILGTTFHLVNSADCYEYDSQYQVWKDKSDNEDYMKKLVANGEKLTITGIVQPSPDSAASALTAGINYPASLTRHVVEEAKKSEIVKQQMADSSIDVFTNQEFGTVYQNSGLDMDSFITVDEDKLRQSVEIKRDLTEVNRTREIHAASGVCKGAGKIKVHGITGKSTGECGIVELESVLQLDLGQILSGLTLNVSEDGMQELASSLMEGYQGYASEHPEADYSHLQEDFVSYINSTEAQEILRRHIQTIIADGGGVSITQEQIKELIQRIFKGYQAYLIKMGYTDPEQFDAYLAEYLQTEEAVQIITTGFPR